MIRGGMKSGRGMEEERGKERETHGHSSVKSTSRGYHGNMERAGRAESRRRGETSGCFEKVHTLLALCTRHPPPSGPALLFACSPTLQPLYWQWRLRCCIVSLTRGVLLDYRPQDAKVEELAPYHRHSRREIDRSSHSFD